MGIRGTRRINGKKEKLTEAKVQKKLRTRYMANPEYELENLFVFDWESDCLLKTKAGYWYEIEIKLSLSDFKNDKKNKAKKFELLESKEEGKLKPNYFSYCVPEELVDKVKDIIPEYAGLISVNTFSDSVTYHKSPELINPNKMTDEELNLTKKFYYNMKSAQEKVDKCLVEDLRAEIRWIKEEFEAAAGYPFKDIF